MLKVIDLFAGGGGMSLGFQKAGFKIVAAFDNWLPAIEIYKKNFNHVILQKDLSKVSELSFLKSYDAEMVIGGPPCQDFSSAGNRTEKERADLTLDFAQIVTNLRPKIFVMENVARIAPTKTLAKAVEIFKASGYGLSAQTLDASLCKVPQLRKRFFLIGVLKERDGVLNPYLASGLAQNPISIFDYLGNSLGTEHYYRHPRSYARRGVFSIYEPSPTIRGVNRPIPKTYAFHEGDTCKNKTAIRPLTTLERSYIQTFPPDFKWEGQNKGDLEQIIGNAVPVNLAEHVANAINRYLIDKNLLF